MPKPETGEVRVAGIVLAAGSSLRLGRDKLYLEIAGESLLRRAVLCAVQADLDPVLVVLGPESDRAAAAIADLRVTPVVNPDHALGMHVSLRKGLEALPGDVEAALISLVDMPFVTSQMLSDVARRYRQERPLLIASRYGSATAPPTLYDRSLFGEFAGDTGGKDVVRAHWDEALVLDWPENALLDVDSEQDLERARARLEGAGSEASR